MVETRERAIKALHRLSEWFFAHGGDSSVDKPIYREDIDALHEVILASPSSDAGGVHRQTPEQVEEDFEKFWRGIVLNEDGSLNVDQTKKELADFHFIMREVPKVYLHITGHRMSKPMYHAEAVIAEADDHLQELINEAVVEARSAPSGVEEGEEPDLLEAAMQGVLVVEALEDLCGRLDMPKKDRKAFDAEMSMITADMEPVRVAIDAARLRGEGGGE